MWRMNLQIALCSRNEFRVVFLCALTLNSLISLFTLNFQEKFLTVFLILVYIFRYLNSLEIKIVRYQYSLLISNLAIVLFGLGKICLTGLEQFWVCDIPSILYVTLISLFLIDFTSFEHRSTTFAKTCPKINDLVLIIWLFSLLLHDNVWPGIYHKFIFQIYESESKNNINL